MINTRTIASLFLSLFCGVLLYAQAAHQSVVIDDEPWEFSDIAHEPSSAEKVSDRFSLSEEIAKRLIRYYQKSISTNSISRCPFAISCSRYALEAIKRKGLLPGMCYFIDRNMYREHDFIINYYDLTVMPDESLKLDDGYYLYGN